MKTNEKQLLKRFASVLRNRANGKIEPISKTLLKHLYRKDLIEIIKKINGGALPKDIDATLMENEELLSLIKDEMFVIAYVIERLCTEQQLKVVSKPSANSNSGKSNASNVNKDKKKP